MSKHTKEPWKLWGDKEAIVMDKPMHSKHGFIAIMACNEDVSARTSSANARRIVACVNACSGMEDPEPEIAELKRQRDELLSALDGLLKASTGEGMTAAEVGAAYHQAIIAIAKTKDGAANHFPYAAKMVPDGWKLVPVVATEEMVNSGHAAWSDGEDDFQSFAMAYGAMLAAAPKFEGGAE